MEPLHVHLMLNHVPVLGSILGFALLLISLLLRNETLKYTSLAIMVLVALVAIPVYLTGEPAEDSMEKLSISDVTESVIEPHEEAAQQTFIVIEVLGIVSVFGFLPFLRFAQTPRFMFALVVLSLAGSILMAYTAYLGGQIRHTEIRSSSAYSLDSSMPYQHEKENSDSD